MTTFNIFYKGTETVNYSFTVETTEEGVKVTGGLSGVYEDEMFPSETIEEFIEDYANDDEELFGYQLEEGKDYFTS